MVDDVEREAFREQGFLIRRGAVPADRLGAVRDAIEAMVERRREVADQRRLPGQPRGGAWAASAQPRLAFDRDAIDAGSAAPIELLLGESTLGVCRQLIDAQHVAPHYMACLCNAEERDHGPATWHRRRKAGPAGDDVTLTGVFAFAAAPVRNRWQAFSRLDLLGDDAADTTDMLVIAGLALSNQRVHDLLATPLAHADTCIAVPDGPGLEVELDDDALQRHAVR